MTCRDFVEFLMEYSSGDLAGSERAEFEAHLAECPECIAYLDTYQKTIYLVKTACAHPHRRVPDDVPERLVQAVLAARAKGAKPRQKDHGISCGVDGNGASHLQ